MTQSFPCFFLTNENLKSVGYILHSEPLTLISPDKIVCNPLRTQVT